MQSTMMDVPLSLNHLLDRAGTLFAGNEIVSRLPDKSLRTHSYGEFYRRTRPPRRRLALARPEEGRPRRHAVPGTITPTSRATSAFRRQAASCTR